MGRPSHDPYALWETWDERKFGADTTFVIDANDLDLPEKAREAARGYLPFWNLTLHEALVDEPADCSDQVLIDYVCCLGRALLFASTLPFKRIIGVELSKRLCG